MNREQMCNYWMRAQFRDIDDTGFGCNPFSLMSEEQAAEAWDAREREDDKDPPCGACEACVDNDETAELDEAIRALRSQVEAARSARDGRHRTSTDAQIIDACDVALGRVDPSPISGYLELRSVSAARFHLAEILGTIGTSAQGTCDECGEKRRVRFVDNARSCNVCYECQPPTRGAS